MKFKTFCAIMTLLCVENAIANIPDFKKSNNRDNIFQFEKFEEYNDDEEFFDARGEEYSEKTDNAVKLNTPKESDEYNDDEEFFDARGEEYLEKINNAIKRSTQYASKRSSPLNPDTKSNSNPLTGQKKRKATKKNHQAKSHTHNLLNLALSKSSSQERGLDTSSNISIQIVKVKGTAQELSSLINGNITRESIETFRLKLTRLINYIKQSETLINKKTISPTTSKTNNKSAPSSTLLTQIAEVKDTVQELRGLINENITKEGTETFKIKHAKLMNYIKELEVLINKKNASSADSKTDNGKDINAILKQKFLELMKYIKTNNVDNVKEIITSIKNSNIKKYMLNATNEYGCTPLWIAAEQKNEKTMMRLLLNNGADINETLLRVIDSNRGEPEEKKNFSTKVVKVLLNYGANANAQFEDGPTILTEVVLGDFSLTDKYALISTLIEHGANPNLPDEEGKSTFYRVKELNSLYTNVNEKLENDYVQKKIPLNYYKQKKEELRTLQRSIEEIKRLLTPSKEKSEPVSKKMLNFVSNKLRRYVEA